MEYRRWVSLHPPPQSCVLRKEEALTYCTILVCKLRGSPIYKASHAQAGSPASKASGTLAQGIPGTPHAITSTENNRPVCSRKILRKGLSLFSKRVSHDFSYYSHSNVHAFKPTGNLRY